KHTRAHTHTHTHTHTHSNREAMPPKPSIRVTESFTHTHFLSLTHTHFLSLTHSHTHTHTRHLLAFQTFRCSASSPSTPTERTTDKKTNTVKQHTFKVYTTQ